MTLIGPELQRAADCEAVLRSLPRWFGIEDALLRYAQDSARLPGFALAQDDHLVGFISLTAHFPEAWEVHCIAVHAQARHQGLGSRLLAHAEHWLVQRGAKFLQVKTLADAHPSPEYAETRRFYTARGYRPLEVFPTLWGPRNPALQLVEALAGG